MKLNLVMVAAASSLLLFSCVSSKKFKTAQAEIQSLQSKQTQLQGDLNNCNDAKAELGRKKQHWKAIMPVSITRSVT